MIEWVLVFVVLWCAVAPRYVGMWLAVAVSTYQEYRHYLGR